MLLGGLAMVALGSCIYDSDSRCGPNQVVRIGGFGEECACDEHSAATPDGCAPCGTHEVPGATGCECEEGYARPGPTEPCAEVETTTPASGGEGGAGTNDNAGAPSSDGQAGATAGGGATSLPEGLGKACTGPADCAGTEATFCDMVVTQACTVEGCSLDPNDCPPGYSCCDLSAFGFSTICALGECL
jgi:hypothetical protein